MAMVTNGKASIQGNMTEQEFRADLMAQGFAVNQVVLDSARGEARFTNDTPFNSNLLYRLTVGSGGAEMK